VQPVTRGQRDVAILWIQSLVREAGQRRALYDLDRAIRSLRERAPESPEILALTGVYHNLLRAAAEL
jgi:PKHD-type hydroxylase